RLESPHHCLAARARSKQLHGCRRDGCRLSGLPPKSGPLMKLFLRYQPAIPASASPYRLVDDQEQEVTWANAFLDAQRIRQLSLRSLRAYGYDLLHFARWWLQAPLRPLSELTESILLDYVRDQLDGDPKPTSLTVNHRLQVLRSLYRFHYGCDIPAGQ